MRIILVSILVVILTVTTSHAKDPAKLLTTAAMLANKGDYKKALTLAEEAAALLRALANRQCTNCLAVEFIGTSFPMTFNTAFFANLKITNRTNDFINNCAIRVLAFNKQGDLAGNVLAVISDLAKGQSKIFQSSAIFQRIKTVLKLEFQVGHCDSTEVIFPAPVNPNKF